VLSSSSIVGGVMMIAPASLAKSMHSSKYTSPKSSYVHRSPLLTSTVFGLGSATVCSVLRESRPSTHEISELASVSCIEDHTPVIALSPTRWPYHPDVTEYAPGVIIRPYSVAATAQS
jgi:hypothetical protein